MSAIPSDLARRLPWLLVFRTAVATSILILTLAVDLADLPLRRISALLYGVSIGTYVVVFVLGMLLRANLSAVVVSAVHLTTAVLAAVMVVQGTGGVRSGFSFLFLLVILDGAIIGGRPVALAVASASSLIFGGQLVTQMYDLIPFGEGGIPESSVFSTVATTHVAAFYLVALLSGYLANLLRREREASVSYQADLLLTEQLHAVVLEALPMGVVTLDSDRRVRTANASAESILGIARDALVGAMLPPSFQRFLDEGYDAWEGEVMLPHKKCFLSLGKSRLRTQYALHVVELEVLVIEDRTDVRALESALQAKARLASLGEIAAGMAHEIRNPLASISGSIELLMRSEHAPDARAKLQQIVLREIERLNRLVEDFLIYARPSQPELVETDLATLVEDLVEVLRGDRRWEDLRIEVHYSERVCGRVDPAQVRQMLWNLVRNAVEASPKQGVVKIHLSVDDGMLKFEVVDEGQGIAPSIREHLFEPFRTTKTRGTGLGLAVVHRIVQAHNGMINAASASPMGTRITVSMPV
ncbi:MAG: ATP-binding protein [Myxococcota bacterium]